MRRVAMVYDPLFLLHKALGPHPESPDRLRAVVAALREAELWDAFLHLPPRNASRDELERTHEGRHVERILSLRGAGFLDPDTYYCDQSADAAVRAAGGALELVDALLLGEVDAGLGLLRPPGHHAERSAAMGFCLFNNVAVAAHHALEEHGLERVLIFDPDVHHGNGTAAIFREDPRVLYVSFHQHPWYPGTGLPEETGEGAGKGRTINVALPEGQRDEDYLGALEAVVMPVARAFDPQLVLISAGFDAHRDDPLGGMRLTEWGYAHLFAAIASLAPTIALLEGGYHLDALGRSAVQLARRLMDPERRLPPRAPRMSPEVAAAVERVRYALAPEWPDVFRDPPP
ncbi:MAG: histone deacetylase [Deltaproteobacteria bacterium]|nr:histone deacetylase [Deltaproteobacteria bacterium]